VHGTGTLLVVLIPFGCMAVYAETAKTGIAEISSSVATAADQPLHTSSAVRFRLDAIRSLTASRSR